MSVLQLRDYADIYTAVREELQIPSTDTTAISRIKRDINIVYQEVCAAHKWRWLKGYRDITLPAYSSTGTVSVTQGSNQVVLSQSIAASKTGFKFTVDGFMEVYTISYHAPGSTTFSLNTDFNGATNPTATFKVWTDKIPLPTDCREVSEVWCDIYRQNLDTLGLQEYRRMVNLSPKNEGRPFYYYAGDFVDPTSLQTISSLPSIKTRASSGVIKTLIFNSSLPTSIVTSVTNGDPVKWNISNAGQSSYNGDVLVSSITTTNVANDTVSYTGLSAYQESATADTSLAVASITQEQSYNRYRELFLYPCLTNTNTAIHVDYVKEILPLNNDSDEPLMPVEDRAVLLYAALARAWTRNGRNPEEAARCQAMADKKLAQMAGKLQGDFDKPKLVPSKMYLSNKRNQMRKRQVETMSPYGFGGSGGASGSPTGPGNSVAVFDSNGDLSGSSAVNTTTLSYLKNVTSDIQAQINATAKANLAQNHIFVGSGSGIATDVPMTGDVSIVATGATTVASVGTSAAAAIHTAEVAANAATNLNTVSTIVKRDGSGNFSAGTITAALTGNVTGNVSGSAASITGNLTGDVTSVGMATTLAASTVTGKTITGFVSGAGTVSASDTILSAIDKLDGNTALKAPIASPTFTGTVTAPTFVGALTGHASADLQASNNLSDVATKATAFNNISPITSTGDLIIGTGTNTASRLAIGSNNTVLSSNGTTASWQPAGTASPLTTKGDTYIFNSANARLPVGTDGQTIVADSTSTNGLRYSTQYKGPKNYITYCDFESNSTTGYSLGTVGTLTNGLPTGTPTFGSGASGNLSIATTNGVVLSGSYSLDYASSAATTVGNMVATQAYTIDSSDQAKVLTVSFSYQVPTGGGASNCNFSGTSSNSFAWAVWDVTNSTWLSSAGNFNIVQSGSVGKCVGTIQTGATTASIRLVIYNANATSGAMSLYLDDFFLGPQTAPIGYCGTDWSANLTVTPNGFGTVTSQFTETRREGDTLHVRGYWTNGTPAASTAGITVSTSVTIDTTKMGSSTNTQRVGWAIRGQGGPIKLGDQTNNNIFAVFYDGSTNNQVFITVDGQLTKQNGSSLVAASETITFEFSVPIAGWSSNVQMSSDTDTRVVAAQYQVAASVASSTSSPINYATQIYDTHGAVTTGASWKFTAPITGYFRFTVAGATSTSSAGVGLYKNGTIQLVLTNQSSTAFATGCGTIQMNAGDYADIRLQGALSTQASGNSNYVCVERVSGPSVIASSESVNASYYLSTNSSAAHIPFDTKIFDSHNAATTGASFVYTAPVSGTYSVSVVALSASGSNNLQLYKNGSMYSLLGTQVSTTAVGSGTIQFKMNAGDTCYINNPGGITITGAAPASNGAVMSIYRVGQ